MAGAARGHGVLDCSYGSKTAIPMTMIHTAPGFVACSGSKHPGGRAAGGAGRTLWEISE